MSDQESVAIAKPEQGELLTADEAFFAEVETQGEYTGDRLLQRRPDTYRAIVVLLGQKMGVIRIGKLLSVSPMTVMAVRDREWPAIERVKEHLANVAHAGATLASEGILATLNEVLQRRHCLGVKDLKDLAVVYGILVQNGQLLAGQPTSRVEWQDVQKPEHDDFNKYIAGLKEANVINLEGEKMGQKEDARTERSEAAESVTEPVTEPAKTQNTNSHSEEKATNS